VTVRIDLDKTPLGNPPPGRQRRLTARAFEPQQSEFASPVAIGEPNPEARSKPFVAG
jgi:hypothetical protein